MASRKRSVWPWIIIIVLLAGGGVGFWQWREAKAKEQLVTYKTEPITRGSIIQAVTANGQITPVKNVQVGSQVSGIIKEVLVDFNSMVTNGQIVAQIDPATYQQNITQSEAELENAKAAMEYAQLNYKRAKELVEAKLISPSEFDKTVADLHQAQAVVRTREASLQKAKVDLERTTIYAPIDGIVISRNIDVGQTVAASFSTPTLFQIANDLRKMQIETMVSEADVGGVENGQDVNFLVDAFPGKQFRGKVVQVRYAPITNQNVVSYAAVVEVNNNDLKLRPGMTASASIITAQKDNVLKILNAALRFRPLESPGATNKAAAAKGGTNQTGKASNTVASAAGPGPGGPGGGDRDAMRQRWASMSPEEREQMRNRFREGGGGRGMGGGGPRAVNEGPVTRTVYQLEKSEDPTKPKFKPVTIKAGISDGTYTELVDGLKEGDEVVTGAKNPVMTGMPQTGQRSPFGGPFGGGMRPR